MDKRYYSVQRRSEREIERLARDLRAEMGVEPEARISMMPLLEFALDEMVDGAYLEVLNDQELGGAEGRTDLYQPIITLAASTYAKLEKGDPRARMTAAHELGHLLMHTQSPIFAYRSRSVDRCVNPEWQADVFAAAFLMPAPAFKKMKSVKQAMRAFGVSRGAALRRARTLNVRLFDEMVRNLHQRKKRCDYKNHTP